MMLLLLSLLGASNPAAVQQQQQQQQTAPAAVAPEPQKEKKICRSDTAVTGSRIGKQTCMTKTGWQRRDQAAASDGASN